MLLLLLLLLGDEAEKKRALIDALLEVSTRSAASISRAAGVAPPALSNLRRPDGAGQVSQELQDLLLAELNWPTGRPDPAATQKWKIKNQAGVDSLHWLLTDLLGAESVFAPVYVIGNDSINSQKPVLIGTLGQSKAVSTISFHALNEQVKGAYDKLLSGSGGLVLAPQIAVSEEVHKSIYDGKMTGEELAKVFSLKAEHKSTQLTSDISAQFEHFGLTREDHRDLLCGWLSELANKDPDRVMQGLRTINKFDFEKKEIYPSSMTESQLKAIFDRIKDKSSHG